MSFTRELLERAHARGFRPTDEIHARERKYQRRLLRGVAAKLGGSGGWYCGGNSRPEVEWRRKVYLHLYLFKMRFTVDRARRWIRIDIRSANIGEHVLLQQSNLTAITSSKFNKFEINQLFNSAILKHFFYILVKSMRIFSLFFETLKYTIILMHYWCTFAWKRFFMRKL